MTLATGAARGRNFFTGSREAVAPLLEVHGAVIDRAAL